MLQRYEKNLKGNISSYIIIYYYENISTLCNIFKFY